ncbi:unnamed protein product [Linum trigynum]|uniref:Uncharacterized protein n=1 Tax=Linum trigynum TaxID=586398 RepID=A0AAV2DFA3_9ROSI
MDLLPLYLVLTPSALADISFSRHRLHRSASTSRSTFQIYTSVKASIRPAASPTLISDLGHDAYSSEGNPIVALASLLVDELSIFEEEVEIADKIMSIGVGNFKGGGTIGQGRQKESGYLPPTRTWKLESRTRHQGKLLYIDGRIFR